MPLPSYLKNPFDVGSPMWMNRMRENARELSKGLEDKFFPLGEVLHEVSLSDAQDRKPMYKQWGYNTFKEYCDRELKLPLRKAQYCRSIYQTVEFDLKGVDPSVRKRFLSLGYSECRRLTGVVERTTVNRWTSFAEQVTTRELVQAVKEARLSEDQRHDPLSPTGGQPSDGLPPQELRKDVRFTLSATEEALVKSALERADAITGGNSKAISLGHICMHFLASEDLLEEVPADVLTRALAEQGYGVVLIDPKTTPHTVVRGGEVLNAFSASHRMYREDPQGKD